MESSIHALVIAQHIQDRMAEAQSARHARAHPPDAKPRRVWGPFLGRASADAVAPAARRLGTGS